MNDIDASTDRFRQINSLRKKIESSLMFGPEQDSNLSIFDVDTSPQLFHSESERNFFWRAAKDEIVALCQDTKTTVTPIFQGLRSRCDNAELYLSQLKTVKEENSAIFDKFSLYLRTEYKIQLLSMVKWLKRLEQSSNILEIPEIVIKISNNTKMTILEKSKIYSFMVEIIRIKKTKLLQKFHKLFEEHLDSEIAINQSTNGNQSEGNNMYDDQKQIWRQFLTRSRQWLLAYAMVSILPSAIIKSSKMVIESFKEALDEAMTPLWGRFYHHLKMGRESYSKNQMLWTFKYAASFIDMLHGLCGHITAADEMRQITTSHNVTNTEQIIDFRKISTSQVVEKALKFLSAHLASIFVQVSQWEDIFGMQLVDEILEFDNWLAMYDPPSYLCHILFESKVFFHHWLMLEQSLVFRQFAPDEDSSSVNLDAAFARKFKTPLNPSESPEHVVSTSPMKRTSSHFVSTDKTEVLQCYSCLYDALQLFLLARQRYAFFGPSAQFIIAEVILEPLLCLSLGFCLYKIRYDSFLFAVSMMQAGSPVVSATLHDLSSSHDTVPESLTLYKDSIAYFQTALDAADNRDSRNATATFIAHESRCKKRWTIVQEWLPKLLLTRELRQQGYGWNNLVKTAMKVSDKYRNHQNFAYRNQWLELQQQLQLQSQTQTQSMHQNSNTNLEACIVITRGLAITMADVLEEQWQLLRAKHISKVMNTVSKSSQQQKLDEMS